MELVGAKPLHLLTQTVPSLKSPTGAFIASQTLIFRRKQIIRTHLLSETSSDYFCLVQHQGAEPEMPHQTAQPIPENSAVDADAAAALTKLLANPSMAELIKNLAKNL